MQKLDTIPLTESDRYRNGYLALLIAYIFEWLAKLNTVDFRMMDFLLYTLLFHQFISLCMI